MSGWVSLRSELRCVAPGGVRLRPAHLAALRPLLPGGPEALLAGGLRHRRHHLHPGELTVTGSQTQNSGDITGAAQVLELAGLGVGFPVFTQLVDI